MQCVFFTLLCLVASANSFAFGHEKEQDVTIGGIECSREGPMCKDCKQLVQCTKGKTDFEVTPLATCTDLAPCDETKKGCVYEGTCRYKKFECPASKVGKFPDPYSCRQFHRCDDGLTYSKSCPFPKAYNPITTACDLTLDQPLCKEGPITACNKNEEILQISGTDYYYKCVEEDNGYKIIYPELYTGAVTTTTELPLSTEAVTTTTGSPPGTCNQAGVIADPSDCMAYFLCIPSPNGGFEKIPKHCNPGSHFDQVTGACKPGECKSRSTKRQILLDSVHSSRGFVF